MNKSRRSKEQQAPAIVTGNGFVFGDSSEREMVGVHPDLVAVNRLALTKTSQDFTVFDGLRSLETQREYVRKGVSQTMNSKHLKQADGFGHAVDNVPWIAGHARWELQPCCVIAQAMREAAEELNIQIRWGGAWVVLNGTIGDPYQLVEAYAERKRRQGRSAFIDGPHFELYGR